VVILALLFTLLTIAPAVADDGPVRKLGRGAANTLFGAGELLVQTQYVLEDDGLLAALTFGPIRGAWRGLVRTGAGLIDLSTFFMPLPGLGFSTMIHPDFLGTPRPHSRP